MNKDASPVQRHNTTVCAYLPGSLALAVALFTFAGCTKRNAIPDHELFRRIQVYEARIAEAELSVRAATSCRGAHGPAEEGVCDPSAALCRLTADTKEQDAVRRCLLAGDSCRAARERAVALCATPDPP